MKLKFVLISMIIRNTCINFFQLKKDILDGKLEVPFDLCSRLFAYALQSEFGDFETQLKNNGYTSNYKFQLNQSKKLEERAEELHKGLTGKMPASVELNFLEEVKNLEFYGTDFFSSIGLKILHQNNVFANYYWTNIIGIYKKGKYFMIKIFNRHNEKTTYGFELPSKKECKNLWRICIEYQLFNKLIQAYLENSNSAINSQIPNQTRLDELTERFRSINLNDLIVRRRKTMYSIFQNLIGHVNGLNKNSSAKDHLKTEQLKGINFTADETCQNNLNQDLDDMQKNKIKIPYHETSNEQNKNEPGILPNGFYLVNKQKHQQATNIISNNTSNNRPASANIKQKQANILISTPGYSVEPTDTIQSKNRKCESVFSARSHRSRAAFSEMAYSDHRHGKHGKQCSHRRLKEPHHKHRHQSGCSHRHKDHRFYDDECLSADEYEETYNNKTHRRNSRSRSFHALCDEIDYHKFRNFNEFDNETNSCTHSRPIRGHRRRHRSCCLNELYYESDGQNENDLHINQKEDVVSLCSSTHSLSKSSTCKRRHKHRKDKIDHKTESSLDISETRSRPTKKRSFENLKLIDQQNDENEPEENQELENQSDISEFSYCSHHSRKPRYSRTCHRSKSRCCKHNRSLRCKHYHIPHSDFDHHLRSVSHRRRKNMSCESLTDQDDRNQSMNRMDGEINQERYRLNMQTDRMMYQQKRNTNTFIQPILSHEQHLANTQKTTDQYLLPVQQFPYYQHSFDVLLQPENQEKFQQISNYSPLAYRVPLNEQKIHDFINAHNNFQSYNTLANKVNFQQTNQIGLPVYQTPNYQSKNHVENQNTIFSLTNSSQVKSELQLLESNKKQHQIYQNLQEMSRLKNSFLKDVPQLPPRNQKATKSVIQAPPSPSKSTKILSNNGNVYHTAHLFEKNSLYAKSSKLLSNNSPKNVAIETRENDNQLNMAKQNLNNSGDSANSSLQNINNLDSGISICSSTPTQDLPCSNKANESKVNDKSNVDDDQLKSVHRKNEVIQKGLSNKMNYDSGDQQQPNIQDKKTNNQQSLEFYEINTELNSTENRTNRTVSLGEYHPVIPKFKTFEISTEL